MGVEDRVEGCLMYHLDVSGSTLSVLAATHKTTLRPHLLADCTVSYCWLNRIQGFVQLRVSFVEVDDRPSVR